MLDRGLYAPTDVRSIRPTSGPGVLPAHTTVPTGARSFALAGLAGVFIAGVLALLTGAVITVPKYEACHAFTSVRVAGTTVVYDAHYNFKSSTCTVYSIDQSVSVLQWRDGVWQIGA